MCVLSCVNNLCRPTGVLPSVPPIPKAPGTLLPAFDSSRSLYSDDVDKTSSNQHSDAVPEKLQLVFFMSFLSVLVQLLLARCTVTSVVSHMLRVFAAFV